MRKSWLIYTLILLSVKVYGMNHTDCADVSNLHLKLSIHTSNLVNAATTRTKRGGFYKKQNVHCAGQECVVRVSSDKKTVYEPGHPDADRRGYVKYPDIDVKSEFSEISKAANELKDLAYKGVCHTQILSAAAEGVVVRYQHSHILSDVFKYSKNNTLVSWARTYLNGRREIFDFSARLSDRKLATSSFAF